MKGLGFKGPCAQIVLYFGLKVYDPYRGSGILGPKYLLFGYLDP